MKVVCVKVPAPVVGMNLESSPWVTVGREYFALSIQAVFGGSVMLHLLTNDGHSLGWFDSDCFETIDGQIPSNWTARIRSGGLLELAPESWLEVGFWENFYDGDSEAREVFKRELTFIVDEAQE